MRALFAFPLSQTLLLGCLIQALLSTFATAADSQNDRLKLTTERVIVFKDGYYMAIKSGTAVTNNEGEVSLVDVPNNAVLGSVWATSQKGKLIAMVASRDTLKRAEEKAIPCDRTIDILQANIGQKAKIVMNDASSFQGEILRVLGHSTTMPLVGQSLTANHGEPDDDAPDGSTPLPAKSVSVSGIEGSQFVIRTDDGDVLLQIAQIKSLTIKDMKTSVERIVTSTSTPKRLTFQFAEPGKAVDVSLIYFQPGLRWIPTYRVRLSDNDKKTAKLDLQAEFLNEAEDLDQVPVDIVVGVPSFRFKDTPSPLTLEKTLRNVLQQAAPHLMSQQLSNSSFSVRSGERFGMQGMGPGNHAPIEAAPDIPAELGTMGTQDLFVYTLKSMKLLKGQRAALPLISAELPYRDVYTWDLHLTRQDTDAQSASKSSSPQVLSENRVWHQVVLTNTTRTPWTTGAVLLMQGNQPLAQALMTYTSAGAEVRIPVTVSVDTPATCHDEETERNLNALKVDETRYARIEKTATLTLDNRKSAPIDIEVSFRTGGKVTETTNAGKIVLNSHAPDDWVNYHGYSTINGSSQVFWKTTLKSGEAFTPTVKYHYLARH